MAVGNHAEALTFDIAPLGGHNDFPGCSSTTPGPAVQYPIIVKTTASPDLPVPY